MSSYRKPENAWSPLPPEVAKSAVALIAHIGTSLDQSGGSSRGIPKGSTAEGKGGDGHKLISSGHFRWFYDLFQLE